MYAIVVKNQLHLETIDRSYDRVLDKFVKTVHFYKVNYPSCEGDSVTVELVEIDKNRNVVYTYLKNIITRKDYEYSKWKQH